jgi:mono/diheme cytochrome c family protein
MPERPPDEHLEQSTNLWMRWGLALIVLAILAFPAYRLYEPGSREESREVLLSSLAEQGEDLYALNCAACHGADGLGGIAPALNSKQFLETEDERIASLISVGIPGSEMSAYELDFGGPMTIEQIDAIVVYLRSLAENAPDFPGWRDPQNNEPVSFPTPVTVATTTTVPPEDAVPDEGGGILAQGEAAYSANCAVCHGNGLEGLVGPALGAGSNVAGLGVEGLRTVIVQGRNSMPAWGGVLSEEEIEAVIAYLQSEQG